MLDVHRFGLGRDRSLDSCISYALEHNLRIKSAEIERIRGEYSVTEAKDAFLPTLNASASQNWDFGRGLTSSNTYANRNTSMFSWGAQMSLPVFRGSETYASCAIPNPL